MKFIGKKTRIAVFSLIAAFALLFPLIISDKYILRLAILSVMYAGLAVSLNLVTGYLGQVSLGHAAFFGIGAYTSALLSEHFALSFIATAICAVLLSALFGVLLGIPSLKLSGSYLAIVSLGFCEIIRLIELNWVSLTRGPMGISGISRPIIFGFEVKSPAAFYYLCMVLVGLICFVVSNLMRSHVGRAIQSIREDATAAASMGINVFKTKVMTFTISAAMVGLMGAFYAHYVRYIDPTTFNFDQSTTILSMVILGGSGSIPGSFLGALILSIAPELLRGLAEIRMLIYGLVIVVMMMFRPQGIVGRRTLAQLLLTEKKYAEYGGVSGEATNENEWSGDK